MAQSTELEVRVFREAGKCIYFDHLGELKGAEDLKAVAMSFNCVIGVLVNGLKEPV